MGEVATIEQDPGLPVAGSENPITPMGLIEKAIAQGASVEQVSQLLELQERWDANQARKEFDAAIASAKAEIPTIAKTRTVNFTSSKGRTHYRHEDLAEIARVVTPILAKHGLSYRFRTSSPPNEPVTVTCIISHRAGHSEENTLAAGRDESGNKNSIQGVGSTITYLQRYTLKSALGLAAGEDDDGQSAEQGQPITDEQRDELLTLIGETETDIEAFCKYMQVESLSDLPGSKFNQAKSALNAKKKREAVQ